jgi:hypothetical protein
MPGRQAFSRAGIGAYLPVLLPQSIACVVMNGGFSLLWCTDLPLKEKNLTMAILLFWSALLLCRDSDS